AMLDRVYEGKAFVKVTLDLDPKYVSSEEKILATDAIVSEDTTQDTTTGGSTTTSSPRGDQNTATLSSGETSQTTDGPSSTKKTTKRVLEPFAGTRRVGMLAPDVRRMSIALVLDESIADAAKQTAIQDAVKAAVGFSEETRASGLQDDIRVLVEKLPETPELEVAEGPGIMDMAREFGPTVAQILGVVLVVFFLKGLLKTPKRATATATLSSSSSASGAARAKSGAEVEEPDLPQTPEDRRRRLRREIERSISEDPAAMSRMLETWLAEQRA
ncbi:MAG: hypothetical protein KDB80_07215, partial [Planctomycetes bacterium]|nr:hypothetical protein [Planctomycetota bacterium]